METDEEIVITVEVPGAGKEDIDISLTCDELSISAKKHVEPEEEAGCVHKHERSYDMYRRMIKLPCAVKNEQAKASLCKGILKITLPKEITVTRTRVAVEDEICKQ